VRQLIRSKVAHIVRFLPIALRSNTPFPILQFKNRSDIPATVLRFA